MEAAKKLIYGSGDDASKPAETPGTAAPTTEPVSGAQGAGTTSSPFDQGNSDEATAATATTTTGATGAPGASTAPSAAAHTDAAPATVRTATGEEVERPLDDGAADKPSNAGNTAAATDNSMTAVVSRTMSQEGAQEKAGTGGHAGTHTIQRNRPTWKDMLWDLWCFPRKEKPAPATTA